MSTDTKTGMSGNAKIGMSGNAKTGIRRREFLILPRQAVGGLLLYTLAGEPFRISAQQNGTVRVPLRFFTEAEARVISAVCERIFPVGCALK